MLSLFNKYLFGPTLPIIVFAAGIFFCFRLSFFHFRHPIKIIGSIFSGSSGDGISPFKAVTVALAGTLGVGNIVGVATAITAGGAGAVFWMMVSALAAMVLKYSEIVLAVKYRCTADGSVHGGAAYYMRDGLGFKKLPFAFSVLSVIAAFTIGNIVQVKAASDALNDAVSVPSLLTGAIIAFTVIIVVFRGIDTIAVFTSFLIPVLCCVYILFAVYIIIINFGKIDDVVLMILKDAFSFRAAGGGMLGFFTSSALRFGVSRGIFSNEAGCGTAPTAHASANAKSPAEQGFWGLFEVFADTVILCGITAFVILISYERLEQYDGIVLAVKAFELFLGDAAGYIISFSVFLFAVATVVCWAFYGIESLHFISNKKSIRALFLLFYCAAAITGGTISSNFVWQLADFTIGSMTLINSVCVTFMSAEVAYETKRYFKR